MIAQGSTEIIRDNLPLQEPNSITTAKTAFSLGGSDDSFLEFGFDCFFFVIFLMHCSGYSRKCAFTSVGTSSPHPIRNLQWKEKHFVAWKKLDLYYKVKYVFLVEKKILGLQQECGGEWKKREEIKSGS